MHHSEMQAMQLLFVASTETSGSDHDGSKSMRSVD